RASDPRRNPNFPRPFLLRSIPGSIPADSSSTISFRHDRRPSGGLFLPPRGPRQARAQMSVPRPAHPAINAWSAEYLDSQYQLYQRDPGAIEPGLRAFFQGFDLARSGAPLGPSAGAPGGASSSPPTGDDRQYRADALISAYRETGHLAART